MSHLLTHDAVDPTHLWLLAVGLSLCVLTATGPTLHARLGDWALIMSLRRQHWCLLR